MAGTGTLNNFQITPQKRAREIRDIYGEAENKRNTIRQRSYNDILSQQSAIAAFNQRIAQMNSQATLASVFQQQQLMNKRAADIEAARAAYQQHYEQYGGTLNESALRFLDQHAKIDVPTFTSIMAGYEHAKASAEQRDRERIEAQVAMAEKSGALDKERAALIEKEIQARMEPEIQAYKSQIEMANARIKTLENQAADDAKFQLHMADAIAKAFGGNGSGNAGLGASSLGNFGSRKKSEGEKGEFSTVEDIDKEIQRLQSGINNFPSLWEGGLGLSKYVNEDNKAGIRVIEGWDEEKILDDLKQKNPKLYEEFEKQVNRLVDKNAKPEKSVNDPTLNYYSNAIGSAKFETGYTSTPKNVTKALARMTGAYVLVTQGERAFRDMLKRGGEIGNGSGIAGEKFYENNRISFERRRPELFKPYEKLEDAPSISDSDVKKTLSPFDYHYNFATIGATPEIVHYGLGIGEKPSQNMPENYESVIKELIPVVYGDNIPDKSFEDVIGSLPYPARADMVLGKTTIQELEGKREEQRELIRTRIAELEARKNSMLQQQQAQAQAQAAPVTQTQFEGYNLGSVLTGQTVSGPQGKYYYYENYPNFRGYGLANIEGLIPEFANRLGNFSNWYSNITGEPFAGSSAYRDVEHQRRVMSQYNDGRAAQPGYSYHGAGAAFDADWQTALAATQRAIQQNPNLLSEHGVTNAVELLDKGLAQYGLERNLKSNPKEQHHIQAIADDAWNTAVNIELLDQHRKQGLLGTQLGNYYMRQQPVVQQQQSTAPWLVSNSDRPW